MHAWLTDLRYGQTRDTGKPEIRAVLGPKLPGFEAFGCIIIVFAAHLEFSSKNPNVQIPICRTISFAAVRVSEAHFSWTSSSVINIHDQIDCRVITCSRPPPLPYSRII